jgi:hypothetical protein
MSRFQVTFDCADPDRQAGFWAAALGYQVQPPPEGYASWQAFLEARGIAYEPGAASAVVDPEGIGPRLFFQRVPEPKTAKNRVHLDLNVPDGRELSEEERRTVVLSEVDRLIGLGATQHRAVEENGEFWVVMTDPEGNEFCVQ